MSEKRHMRTISLIKKPQEPYDYFVPIRKFPYNILNLLMMGKSNSFVLKIVSHDFDYRTKNERPAW